MRAWTKLRLFCAGKANVLWELFGSTIKERSTMRRVLVLQSAASGVADWQQHCMAGVQAWAEAQGYAYRRLGDTLFEQVPNWYMAKVRGRMPVAADLGRLQWAQRLLQEGYDWVLWFDADTLIFAPNSFSPALGEDCVFGQEHWVQPKRSGRHGWQVRRNIHNAFAAFPKDCVVLPFLIDLILRMMIRVDPSHIAPQMMGPKLLSSLHSLANFEHLPQIGALSPHVLMDIAGDQPSSGALSALCQHQTKPLEAANLCASLFDELGDNPQLAEKRMERVLNRLLKCTQGLSHPHDLGA
jgi:hypothetical protein